MMCSYLYSLFTEMSATRAIWSSSMTDCVRVVEVLTVEVRQLTDSVGRLEMNTRAYVVEMFINGVNLMIIYETCIQMH